MKKKTPRGLLTLAMVLSLVLAIGTAASVADTKLNTGSGPDYLCFTGTGEFTVSMISEGDAPPNVNLEYCAGDCSVPENWKTFKVNETKVTSTAKVYFRGTANARFSRADDYFLENYNQFCLTANEGVTVAASGNIMTLLDYAQVPENLDEKNESAFAGLFKDCFILTEAPNLPSLKTVQKCYMSMFENCKLLTKAPDLPAKNLAERCYCQMFKECTALKSSPKISNEVTAAGENSCQSMFHGCTSLQEAPVLSATKLSGGSYLWMFYNCTSLTTAPKMSLEEVGFDSCYFMFANCTSLKDASDIEAKDMNHRSYYGMFADCKSLARFPQLEFETSSTESCIFMFDGCKHMLISEGNVDDYDWKIPAFTSDNPHANPVNMMARSAAPGSVTVSVPESGYNYYKVTFSPYGCFMDKNENGIRDEGEIQYVSIQDALNDAEDKQKKTIVLLRDCTENIRIESEKIIVLNLNNHVLTGVSSNEPVILNDGDLTIKGAGDTKGSTIHKWIPNNNPADDIPDGLWVMEDEAKVTESVHYFVSEGGVITGGTGAGIIVNSYASLKLQNTNVIGNNGGGIHCNNKSSLQITGGRISGNISTKSKGVGGVYAIVSDDNACSQITLGGNVVIDANKGVLADNLAFLIGKGNILLENPGEYMRVGVSLIDNNTCIGGVFAKNVSKDHLKHFFSDVDCYMVTVTSDELVLSSRINQKPEQSNNYTVGVDMEGLSYETPSYQWRRLTKNVSCTADMFEETITIEDTGMSGFAYNTDKDTYSTNEYGMILLQPKKEYVQSMDKISFKVDKEIDFLIDYLTFEQMKPDKDGYYTMDVSLDSQLGITGYGFGAVDAELEPQPLTISELTYSGKRAVEGQTKSSLTATQAGTYQCLVTFEDGSTVSLEEVDLVPTSNQSSTPVVAYYNLNHTFTIPVSGNEATVKIQAKINGNTATVKEIKESDLKTAGTEKQVVIDLSEVKDVVDAAIITKTSVKNIVDSSADGMKIIMPDGTTAEFDKTATKAIADWAQGTDIKLVIDRNEKAEQTLTSSQKTTLETMSNPSVIDAYVVSGGVRISDFNGGIATVTAEYKSACPVRIWYLMNNGEKEKVASKYDKEKQLATFDVNHFSHYVVEQIGEEEIAETIDAVSKIKIRGYSKYVKVNGKRYIKPYIKVLKGEDTINTLKDAGYKFKYVFYRSTSTKTSSFKKVYTTKYQNFTDKKGTNGKYYYYRAILKIYDENGELVKSTKLSQCKYGCRLYNEKFKNMK